MLSPDRLSRAFGRLRSERPSHWRDELDADDHALLKTMSVRELSALEVLLRKPADLREDETVFYDTVWRRVALRRRHSGAPRALPRLLPARFEPAPGLRAAQDGSSGPVLCSPRANLPIDLPKPVAGRTNRS